MFTVVFLQVNAIICLNPIVLSRFVLFLYCGPLHVGCGQRIINRCPFTVCPVFCVDVQCQASCYCVIYSRLFKLLYFNAPCILCIHVPVCTLQLDTKAFPPCTFVRDILTPFSLMTNGMYKRVLAEWLDASPSL